MNGMAAQIAADLAGRTGGGIPPSCSGLPS
jgi:hypothetical protein